MEKPGLIFGTTFSSFWARMTVLLPGGKWILTTDLDVFHTVLEWVTDEQTDGQNSYSNIKFSEDSPEIEKKRQDVVCARLSWPHSTFQSTLNSSDVSHDYIVSQNSSRNMRGVGIQYKYVTVALHIHTYSFRVHVKLFYRIVLYRIVSYLWYSAMTGYTTIRIQMRVSILCMYVHVRTLPTGRGTALKAVSRWQGRSATANYRINSI